MWFPRVRLSSLKGSFYGSLGCVLGSFGFLGIPERSRGFLRFIRVPFGSKFFRQRGTYWYLVLLKLKWQVFFLEKEDVL